MARQPVDTGTANPGTAHVCVSVDDLRAVHRTLRRAGVEFVSEPVLVTSGANKGRIAVYAKDPDGIRVELLQPRPVEELD